MRLSFIQFVTLKVRRADQAGKSLNCSPIFSLLRVKVGFSLLIDFRLIGLDSARNPYPSFMVITAFPGENGPLVWVHYLTILGIVHSLPWLLGIVRCTLLTAYRPLYQINHTAKAPLFCVFWWKSRLHNISEKLNLFMLAVNKLFVRRSVLRLLESSSLRYVIFHIVKAWCWSWWWPAKRHMACWRTKPFLQPDIL